MHVCFVTKNDSSVLLSKNKYPSLASNTIKHARAQQSVRDPDDQLLALALPLRLAVNETRVHGCQRLLPKRD